MHFNDFYILSKKFPLLFCVFLYILFKDTLICSVGHMNCSLWQYIYVTDRKNLRPNLERSVGTVTAVSAKQTMQNPIVTIEMENGDIIKAELYPDIAPNSVKNFISLINKGYYDGLIFHRVIAGFMIQGGCPDGTGMGGPGYSIPGEFSQNGFKNELKHTRGVLSMARSMFPDSAGSQFFIMHKNAPHLDGAYAAFGKVTEGMDAVDRIAETRVNMQDRPLNPQVMKKVTVETFGENYGEPEKV